MRWKKERVIGLQPHLTLCTKIQLLCNFFIGFAELF